MKERKMKVEGVMALSQAADYLEKVLTALREGRLTLEAGQETMELAPADVVDFEMEVSRKKDKDKLQLEISWKTGGKSGVELVLSAK